MSFSTTDLKIKICCIQNKEEAKLAVKYGADALGMVGEMPSGPGQLPIEKIGNIVEITPPAVSSFLLTSYDTVEQIVGQQKIAKANTIQLCKRLHPKQIRELRIALPGITLVHVIHVFGKQSIDEAIKFAPNVDALLLDTGFPESDTPVLGGTGKTHDWNISRQICESVDIPVFLAGGLNPENVVEAIKTVKPYGVDICSGVRIDGLLDEKKLENYISRIKNLN
jgi:phosphoribosylanthranilate isomerase